MGVRGNVFQSAGQRSVHYIPGGYSRIDTPIGQLGLVSFSNAVIVGTCTGGKPNVIQWFDDPNQVANVLRGGDLMEAGRFALNPGGDLNPQRIGLLRVNSALQAVGTLLNGVTDIIDYKSRDYGVYTNNIKRAVATATTKGKKLTVTLNDVSQTIDNIFKDSVNIQYIGDASTAVMTIDNTQLTTTLAGDQTDGSVDLTVSFATFDTIEKLVGYINSQVGYSCTLVDGVNQTNLSSELDAYTAQDIKSSEIIITSNVQAMIDAINNLSNYLSDAVLHSGSTRLQLDNSADVFLTGGSEGSETSIEHTNALIVLEQEDVQCVGTTSEDYAIHSLYKTHVEAMNAVDGKRERQFILGALKGETLSGAISQAKVLNSKGNAFCLGQFKDYDINGTEIEWGSVFYAAKMIGQFAALDIIQPHTFKGFNATELTTVLSNPEKEEAIKNGVWVPEVSPQGTFRTVRSITTYQQDNLIWNEFSMSRTVLFVSRDFRNYMEVLFVGKAGDTTLIQSMQTLGSAKLDTYRNDDNFFVDNPNPGWDGRAWKDLRITINGDQYNFQYDATITSPVTFMFITNRFSILVTI